MNLETLTRDLACDRIELYASEGRLVQGVWHGGGNGDDGRDLACLLGSIDPDIDDPDKCPATVMPAWLARLLPTLFDGVRKERAIDYGIRFARVLRTGNTDETVMRRFLISCVENAVRSAMPKGPPPTYWAAVEKSCADVVALLRDGAPSEAAARAAEAEAEAEAAARAAEAAARAARADAASAEAAEAAEAAGAARAALEAAGWAAARAALAASAEAAEAAEAVGAARAALEAAGWAAEAEAEAQYERLFDSLLEAMAP